MSRYLQEFFWTPMEEVAWLRKVHSEFHLWMVTRLIRSGQIGNSSFQGIKVTDVEELPVPDAVLKARKKAEMARIWLADGDQVVTLSSRLWDDPGAWGLMLVDMARHIAKAYEGKGLEPAETLRCIRAAMDAEWSHPTA